MPQGQNTNRIEWNPIPLLHIDLAGHRPKYLSSNRLEDDYFVRYHVVDYVTRPIPRTKARASFRGSPNFMIASQYPFAVGGWTKLNVRTDFPDREGSWSETRLHRS